MGRPKTFDEDAAVRAAMELFWTQGYEGTTPAELGTALGIGRGSLYHAFGSKHALYRRALEHYVADQRAQFVAILEGEGTTGERLHRALATLIDECADPRGCLITMAAVEAPPGDPETVDLVRAVLADQRGALTAVIEDGRRVGDLPAGPDAPDAGAAADALIALMNGARVMQRAGVAPRSLADAAMRLL